jgi:1,4-dihydroxy-2-naphthoyl-CoA hydrolase
MLTDQLKNVVLKNTLMEILEIDLIEATKDLVMAKMPVGPKVHQPFGFLHGGASVALAETVASLGAYLNVAQNNENAFGLEINANHVRPKRDGVVTATATPLHRGRSTHIWDVRIVDEDDKLVCVSRCTIAITPGGR